MPRSRSRRSRRSNGRDSRDASRSRSAPPRRSRSRSRARGRRSTSSSKSSKSFGRRLPRAWRARQQSCSSSASRGGLWKRLKRLRPRSVSREAQREVEDEDREEQQEMEHKLHKLVRANRRQDALQSALRILEGGLHCDPDLFLGMLENAATSPGTEMFAYTLHCTVVAGGLRLSPEEFCKILGIMIFRQALVPQIRAFLNVALPKDAKPVPVIPDGLTEAEADQLFREERVVVEEAGEELQSDDEDFGNQAPSAITMQRCRAHPELNGRYVLCLEFSAPGRPVYQKESAKDDLDCQLLGDSQEQIYVLYREKPDNAWVISNGLKGRALLTNSREARSPPCLGWQTVDDDGRKDDDPGGFMQKQVGISTRETRFEESSNPVKQEAADAKGSVPTATDVRAARQALECLDLKQLRGHIACSDPCVAEYFGHFVVLAHLEHLADVSSIKKRRERSSADQLVRWGYALSGLKLLSTFGRREVGNRQGRILPGWEDTGTEMAAMQLPMNNVDVDRMRIRRGDSVTISTTDPLQDKLAEGTISDIRPGGTLIVQVRGIFPEDCRETLWRVDKSANATVYERQMWALLGLNHAVRVQPTIELMTAAPVGMADRWAMRWQERPKVEEKKPRRRSPSKARKKRKKRSASSASKASESSSELEKMRRRKRCSQLAECELVDDHREEKLLQAQREVDEVEDLNPSQRSALNASLTRTCTVVQGPPGTGKTSVSVQILHFWTKIMSLTPVLATSDSNVAVDNICEGLRARGVKAVRVGRPEKVRSVIEDMTLEAELKRLKEQQQPNEEGKDGEKEKDDDQEFKQGAGKGGKMGGKFGKFSKGKGDWDDGDRHARHFEDRRAQSRQDFELQMKILREAEVICTTTIAAGMDFLARLSNFEAILVDEVAQATELSTAVPVILRGANRLVLVGDHCQLPPAVLSPEAELRGLSVSVYSRLVQAGGLKPFMLDTQYRSHPKLAEFSSQAFYDGMLKSGIEAGRRPLPSGVPWPNSDCPIAFINVDAQEELEGDSKANSVEAQMVANLVGKVFQYGELNVGQVGVVTPYVAQVRRLRQMLRPVIPPGSDFRLLECASVDNFQGREKELIVFSAVRSNRAGNVGFLADWRRLNVMLTRARRGLLIFGNAATLKQDPTWKKWLTFAEQHDCVVKDLPMPQIPYGKGPMSGMWPGPGGKGKVMKGLPPRPMAGRNPMLAAAQAAKAAAEVSADLQLRAEDAQSPWEVDATVAPAAPAPRPWLRERPAFPQLGAANPPDPQMQMQRQLDEQLQQLTQLESQLNHQQQQLHQKQLQAAQLLFVNPIMAQVQMQQIQQENNQLQHRWTELEAQKARLQEQRRRVPVPNSNGVASSNIFAEHMQIEKLLERQLGL